MSMDLRLRSATKAQLPPLCPRRTENGKPISAQPTGKQFKKKYNTEDMKTNTEGKEVKRDSKITRKEALKKVGKYAAFTASAAIILLSPKEAQADSTTPEGRGADY